MKRCSSFTALPPAAGQRSGLEAAAAMLRGLFGVSDPMVLTPFTRGGDRWIDLSKGMIGIQGKGMKGRLNGLDHPPGRSGRYRSNFTVPLIG